ncbi:MAG: aconitate hydratase AcnA, partial [Thermodesulfobacteriota bacterium]
MDNDAGRTMNLKARLDTGDGPVTYYDLRRLAGSLNIDLDTLPFSIRILLENMARHAELLNLPDSLFKSVAAAGKGKGPRREMPFMPARILMQDFTGVPAVADTAAMRDAVQKVSADPEVVNPHVPVDLVIDHSVQVDSFGSCLSFGYNAEKEFYRNRERYEFLRWGQDNLERFNVIPLATGICHQVNLEYLASVVFKKQENGETLVFPDTLVGLDSHTTMINCIGVLGWGVGGIEAEAVMLGRPYYMLCPEVFGVELTGELPPEVTATDLVLTLTSMLREKDVVGKFVEFYGKGTNTLSLPDRATVSNMAPEYGATASFFPVDERTLEYLELTGRSAETVDLVSEFCRAQNLFRTDDANPVYSDTLHLDLGRVAPCLAGPSRPQDRVALKEMRTSFENAVQDVYHRDIHDRILVHQWEAEGGNCPIQPQEQKAEGEGEEETLPLVRRTDDSFPINHGAVVIAAITSCTNTSNPDVMLGAGILAKNAVRRGINVKPWVKTSLAPGSKVVMEYLEKANLLTGLEALNFHLAAFGCTTCIGNSGPLPADIAETITRHNLITASVLSGNRNFEGRINPLVQANYLASPILVVAYALAGTVRIDFETDPLGHDPDGNPVFLSELWPAAEEIKEAARLIRPEMFTSAYSMVFEGDEQWKSLPRLKEGIYPWNPDSTYIRKPPFLENLEKTPGPVEKISKARVLAMLGDSVTTDHISPAGAIPEDSPAAEYLVEHGVTPEEFNTYGSRRGNHEVMVRGTFGNIRLKNLLLDDVEGGFTLHFPTETVMPIFDAAVSYQEQGVDLVVLAGKEYGTGSSRDWAAKGTMLLGVSAVIAESYERIHRSNLVAMGVLPLQFENNQGWKDLGL